MKIKLFQGFHKEKLEEEINSFMNNKVIVDVQMVVLPAPNDHYNSYIFMVKYKG